MTTVIYYIIGAAPFTYLVAYVAARAWFRGKFSEVRRVADDVRDKAMAGDG